MAGITLRLLDGTERGRAFEDMSTPVTMGREEGNTIQLNDERVSRFHAKIQVEHDELVLTDLESTNGTRVNGETVRLRVLRYGDMISIGRSVLRFGSDAQIARRLAGLRGGDADALVSRPLPDDDSSEPSQWARAFDFELGCIEDSDDLQATLHVLEPPDLPQRLTPAQAAQIAELIEYVHIRVRRLLQTVTPVEDDDQRITLELRQWQDLLDLQAKLAEYLARIGEPEDE